jgi:hypothetical protein
MEILIFTHDPDYAAALHEGGVDGLIVDWEEHGKEGRQSGWDTEINAETAVHLERIRDATPGKVICRINNLPVVRRIEAHLAAQLGADEVLLPMVRTVREIEECQEGLSNGCCLGILVETPEALALGNELARLPLSRVYAGLNDLAILRRSPGIFTALGDGTLEAFRTNYAGRFGFGGVTLVDRGEPVPCRLLVAEMMRLRCDFLVGRRAFRRDVPLESVAVALRRIRRQCVTLARRSPEAVEADHEELMNVLQRLGQLSTPRVCAS